MDISDTDVEMDSDELEGECPSPRKPRSANSDYVKSKTVSLMV